MYSRISTSRRESIRNVTKRKKLVTKNIVSTDDIYSSFSTSGTLSPDVTKLSNGGHPFVDTPRGFKVGRYLLMPSAVPHKADPSIQLYTAINVDTEEKYQCKAYPVAKYKQSLQCYQLIEPHEGVNTLYELVITNSYAYAFFASNYGDLHTYVREKKVLEEREAARLFEQILTAIRHCLRCGVLVRDIKLRKFVFRDESKTKLMLLDLEDAVVLPTTNPARNSCYDNDLELVDDSLTERHGCPAYVSPEILGLPFSLSSDEEPAYSGRAACVWSLGVLLFTMLAGRYPFHDTEPGPLFAKIRSGRYTMPESLSPLAKSTIAGMLRVEPSERLSVSELLRHPWLQVGGDTCLPSGVAKSAVSLWRRCGVDNDQDQLVPDLPLSVCDNNSVNNN